MKLNKQKYKYKTKRTALMTTINQNKKILFKIKYKN